MRQDDATAFRYTRNMARDRRLRLSRARIVRLRGECLPARSMHSARRIGSQLIQAKNG